MSRSKDFRFINLTEIPEHGRAFEFNRKTGDLNDLLKDIIGDREFDVNLFIRPMGNAYEMTGQVQTKVAEVCSLCGWDIDVPITKRINEILLPKDDTDRTEQSVHGNQAVDFLSDGPAVSEYKGNSFDAGEFVHEVIAISEPLYPNCGDTDCEHLKESEKLREELASTFEAQVAATPGHPGFAALKDIKIKR